MQTPPRETEAFVAHQGANPAYGQFGEPFGIAAEIVLGDLVAIRLQRRLAQDRPVDVISDEAPISDPGAVRDGFGVLGTCHCVEPIPFVDHVLLADPELDLERHGERDARPACLVGSRQLRPGRSTRPCAPMSAGRRPNLGSFVGVEGVFPAAVVIQGRWALPIARSRLRGSFGFGGRYHRPPPAPGNG